MASCVAYGCVNRNARKGLQQLESEKTKKITFHKFPKNNEKRQLWIKAVRRENWEPTASSVLCSVHFTEDCFDLTSLCYVRLREHAVPTVFPAFPPHLQQVKRKRKAPHSASQTIDSVLLPSGEEEILPVKRALIDSPEKNLKCDRGTSVSPGKFPSPTKKHLVSSIEELRKKFTRKVKTLQEKNRRYLKKLACLDVVIDDLRAKNLVSLEGLDLLVSIAGSNKELLKRQVAKAQKCSLPRTYGKELRTFALTLHYFSPRAYCYVRSHFNSCLPHPKTISKWYKGIDGEPGFTSEAFQAVKIRATQDNHKTICSLVFDEMALRRHVEFDGHGYQGFVDMGTGLDSDDRLIAKEALVFMLVAVNGSWKIPVGYFLIDGINAEQKSNLVLQCIDMANENGVRVVSVTFDGVSTNFSMANHLGCSLDPTKPLKTWFIPEDSKYRIVVFPDPSHMAKLVRNTLGEKHKLLDGNGGIILWDYFTKLHHIQEQEGLHLGNKLKSCHIYYQNQKMKVNLATQLLSRSVADAMEYLNQKLGDVEFQRSSATVKFIRVMNDLFDVLNSKNLRQYDFKKPIDQKNCELIFGFLDEAVNYIRNLKLDSVPIIQSSRKTGFLGLIICIESLKLLYSDLCCGVESSLVYLPAYKLSQDHLEFFFGNIRMHGGFNNNPTVRQYKSAYKKCLVHMELKASTTGNAIPLEEIAILNCSSVNRINLTSSTMQFIDDESETTMIVEEEMDHAYLFHPQEITEYAHHIIVYIAGFVARHLSTVVKCENCLTSLTGNSENLVNSLIKQKDRGGLVYPSHDLVQVCEICEKVIRTALAESGGKFLLKKFTIARLTCFVMKTFLHCKKPIFTQLEKHSNDQEPLNNHRLHLIRGIAEYYFKVRIHYICKRSVDKAESKRQVWNKLVLFKGY